MSEQQTLTSYLFTKLQSIGLPIHPAIIPSLIQASPSNLLSDGVTPLRLPDDLITPQDATSTDITNIYKSILAFYLSSSWSNQPLLQSTSSSYGSELLMGQDDDNNNNNQGIFLPTISLLYNSNVYFYTAIDTKTYTCRLCSLHIPAYTRLNQKITLYNFINHNNSNTANNNNNNNTNDNNDNIFCNCCIPFSTLLASVPNHTPHALQQTLSAHQLYIPGTFIFQALQTTIITSNPLAKTSTIPSYGINPNPNDTNSTFNGFTSTVNKKDKVKEMGFVAADGVFGIPALSITSSLNNLIPSYDLTYKHAHKSLPKKISYGSNNNNTNDIEPEDDIGDIMSKINKSLHPLFKFFENLTTEEHQAALHPEDSDSDDDVVSINTNIGPQLDPNKVNKQYILTRNLFLFNFTLKITHATLLNINTIEKLNDCLEKVIKDELTESLNTVASQSQTQSTSIRGLYTRKQPPSTTSTSTSTTGTRMGLNGVRTNLANNNNNTNGTNIRHGMNNDTDNNNTNITDIDDGSDLFDDDNGININPTSTNSTLYTTHNTTNTTNHTNTSDPCDKNTKTTSIPPSRNNGINKKGYDDDDDDVVILDSSDETIPELHKTTSNLHSSNTNTIYQTKGSNKFLQQSHTSNYEMKTNQIDDSENYNFDQNNIGQNHSYNSNDNNNNNTIKSSSKSGLKFDSSSHDDLYDDPANELMNEYYDDCDHFDNTAESSINNNYNNNNPAKNSSNQGQVMSPNNNSITSAAAATTPSSIYTGNKILTKSYDSMKLNSLDDASNDTLKSTDPLNPNDTNNYNNPINSNYHKNQIHQPMTSKSAHISLNSLENNLESHNVANKTGFYQETQPNESNKQEISNLTSKQTINKSKQNNETIAQNYIVSIYNHWLLNQTISSLPSYDEFNDNVTLLYPKNGNNNTPQTVQLRPSNIESIYKLYTLAQGHIPTMKQILIEMQSLKHYNSKTPTEYNYGQQLEHTSLLDQKHLSTLFTPGIDMLTEVSLHNMKSSDQTTDHPTSNNHQRALTSSSPYLPITPNTHADFLFNYYPGRYTFSNGIGTHFSNIQYNACNEPHYLSFLISLDQLHTLTRDLFINVPFFPQEEKEQYDGNNVKTTNDIDVDITRPNGDITYTEVAEHAFTFIGSVSNENNNNNNNNNNNSRNQYTTPNTTSNRHLQQLVPTCSILFQLHPYWINSFIGERSDVNFKKNSKLFTSTFKNFATLPLGSSSLLLHDLSLKKYNNNDNISNNRHGKRGGQTVPSVISDSNAVYGILVFPYRLNAIPKYYGKVPHLSQWLLTKRYFNSFGILQQKILFSNMLASILSLQRQQQHSSNVHHQNNNMMSALLLSKCQSSLFSTEKNNNNNMDDGNNNNDNNNVDNNQQFFWLPNEAFHPPQLKPSSLSPTSSMNSATPSLSKTSSTISTISTSNDGNSNIDPIITMQSLTNVGKRAVQDLVIPYFIPLFHPNMLPQHNDDNGKKK